MLARTLPAYSPSPAVVLVDGMNVIGSRPDGWWRDRTAAMERLLADVAAWATREPGAERVVVVLDGRPRELGDGGGGVEVRFAPVADDAIAETAAAGDVVVTSDRELVARVQARGARVVSSQTFRRALDGS